MVSYNVLDVAKDIKNINNHYELSVYNAYQLYAKIENPSVALIIHWLNKRRYGKQHITPPEYEFMASAYLHKEQIDSICVEMYGVVYDWYVCQKCGNYEPAFCFSPSARAHMASGANDRCRACVIFEHEKFRKYSEDHPEIREKTVENYKKKKEVDPSYRESIRKSTRISIKLKKLQND